MWKKLSLFISRCKDAIQACKLEDIDVSVDQGKWHNIKEEKIKKKKKGPVKAPRRLYMYHHWQVGTFFLRKPFLQISTMITSTIIC
jgi:hypothetical protein